MLKVNSMKLVVTCIMVTYDKTIDSIVTFGMKVMYPDARRLVLSKDFSSSLVNNKLYRSGVYLILLKKPLCRSNN